MSHAEIRERSTVSVMYAPEAVSCIHYTAATTKGQN